MKKYLQLSLFTAVILVSLNIYVSAQPSAAPTISQLLLEENFVFSGFLTDNGWANYIGSGFSPSTTTGLTYTGHPGSGVGNAALIRSHNSGEVIVYREFTEINTSDFSLYYSFLANVIDSASNKTGTYFIHTGELESSFLSQSIVGRVFARIVNNDVQFGISNDGTPVYGTTNYLKNTTYLFIVKYSISSTGSDEVKLWVKSTGIPLTEIEAGTPEVVLSFSEEHGEVESIALRQGNANQATIVVDAINISALWENLFPVTLTPAIVVSPDSLSGFTYSPGGGPSASHSYILSGNNFVPAAGNTTVTGSANYEVSLDDITFSAGVSVGYTGGILLDTTVYVRLIAGLPDGIYDGEIIANDGGGASTQNVTCSGGIYYPEPSNYSTNFAAALGIPSYYYINLSWTDAVGGTPPDAYLIKGSEFHFDSIAVPLDGVPESNSLFVQNVNQGVQALTFGMNSGTNYYFKIFPYTNSGSQIDYKTDGIIPQVSIATDNAPSLPVTENFEYVTGSLLTGNAWIAHSGVGTNSLQVDDTALVYTDYENSELGKSVTMALSGEDVNRAFNSVSTQSIYSSFMVNILSAQTAGTYFFHLAPENSSSLFYSKVFVKNDGADNIAFGISKKNTGDVIYTPFNYALHTTYLVVAEYVFNPVAEDTVHLWINPMLDGTIPSPDITQTDLGADANSLGMFALRQGSFSSSPELKLGGIRIADNWIPEPVISTFQLSVSVVDGWNMVSVPGLHPTDQNVITWWTGQDSTYDVFKYNNGYQVISTTIPAEGYWMKNSGANVYNTGDEWPVDGIQIVTHDPIPANAGWNLFGCYESIATTSLITTTPPGLIASVIFGFSGGYTPAAAMQPGYSYWVKLTAAGDIIIPSALLSKSGAEPVEYFKEEWGRIIITDNAGRTFILYAVTDDVPLDYYEMPPSPPQGSFDIRFSSNRVAEDINTTSQTIDLNSGVEYPIVVKVENMDIRIQDESGRVLNEVIEAGQQITINSRLDKLVVAGELVPEVYALEQNYPNPFNPNTVIEFSLPEDVSNVRLTIYNALGERVAELVNTTLQAGKYSYKWDAANAATGVYIYELRTNSSTGGFVSVKKMLMIK